MTPARTAPHCTGRDRMSAIATNQLPNVTQITYTDNLTSSTPKCWKASTTSSGRPVVPGCRQSRSTSGVPTRRPPTPRRRTCANARIRSTSSNWPTRRSTRPGGRPGTRPGKRRRSSAAGDGPVAMHRRRREMQAAGSSTAAGRWSKTPTISSPASSTCCTNCAAQARCSTDAGNSRKVCATSTGWPTRPAPVHLDWWLAWACRCRIPAFVTLAKTIRANPDRILAAVELGLSNSKLEGINSRIRLINHRGYGHHTAAALIAMIYLCCGEITVQLPRTER